MSSFQKIQSLVNHDLKCVILICLHLKGISMLFIRGWCNENQINMRCLMWKSTVNKYTNLLLVTQLRQLSNLSLHCSRAVHKGHYRSLQVRSFILYFQCDLQLAIRIIGLEKWLVLRYFSSLRKASFILVKHFIDDVIESYMAWFVEAQLMPQSFSIFLLRIKFWKKSTFQPLALFAIFCLLSCETFKY